MHHQFNSFFLRSSAGRYEATQNSKNQNKTELIPSSPSHRIKGHILIQSLGKSLLFPWPSNLSDLLIRLKLRISYISISLFIRVDKRSLSYCNAHSDVVRLIHVIFFFVCDVIGGDPIRLAETAAIHEGHGLL